ncbi:MAG: DUF4912 domain-containing protein [Thermodesulfovibrionales bacterium]
MTKKELLGKKITELRSMAREMGLSVPRTATKEELAALISKTMRLKTLRKRKKEVKPVSKKTSKKKPSGQPVAELKPVSIKEERPVLLPDITRPSLAIMKNLLGLVPVNQQTFYIYWEINKETRELYEGERFIIRIYDITGGKVIETAPYFELQVQQDAGGFHIDMGRSGEFCAEMGIKKNGRFMPFLRSNTIGLPKVPDLKELPEAVRVSFPSGIVHPTSP